MAKHLVIRHDGNGVIRKKDITIESFTPTDIAEGRYFEDDNLVCYIPLSSFPLIKEIEGVLASESNEGCSDDLTVVSKDAITKLSMAINKLQKGN
jgi:hypothetical protein